MSPLWCQVTPTAFAGRSVLAEQKQSKSNNDNVNTRRHDERDLPYDMQRRLLVFNKRGVDGSHKEIGDATASILGMNDECVCGTHDVLIEETRRPYLTGNKAATDHPTEE